MAGSPAVPEQAQSSRRAYTPVYIDSKRPGVLLEYSEKIAYGLCAVCGSAPAVNLVHSKLGFSLLIKKCFAQGPRPQTELLLSLLTECYFLRVTYIMPKKNCK